MKLVEFIRQDYKSAVLCPFPWCEDELQLNLSNVFTRLQINRKAKERAKLTDDIVNMTEVFRPHAECNKPRVVLIEGDPGMGKTTYCQKLAYDWSVGEIPPEALFPKVEMLLLLKCRDMNTVDIEEAIDDQLLPQDADKKEKQDFFHFLRSNQSRVLLVLDGVDELRQDLFQGFLPLIQGKVFFNTFVILTARHEAGLKMRRYCDTLLEIAGYTHNDADNYIKKYFSNHDDPSLAEKMIQKLGKDSQLRELTANPLNTALLCLLCEDTKGKFPSKRTEMYDALVECAIRRYFAKRGVPLDDDDPIERYSDQLNQLGKMAFEALLKGQLYFSESAMKCKSTDFLRLCFLSREPGVSKIRPVPCYAFTHKTFQEYFAALYLAHHVLTGDQGAQSLLGHLSPIDNWQVWEFLLAMVTRKSGEKAVFAVSRLCAFFYRKRLKNVVDTNAYARDSWKVSLKDKPGKWFRDIIKWSEDEDTLNDVLTKTLHLIAECEDDERVLKDYQTKMVHVLARCFPLTKIKLTPCTRYCSVYSEYFKVNCTLLDLWLCSDLNELVLATMKEVFHPEHKLVHFSLAHMNIDIFTGMVTPPSEQKSAFSDLRRRISWTSLDGAKALAKVLQSGLLLTHVNIDDVMLCDSGVHALAEVLHMTPALTHLSLCNGGISDPGAIAIANVLQSNCRLTHLSLPLNWIGGIGLGALAKSLQTNRALKYLDLRDNFVDDSVAETLAQALKSECVLTYLDVSQTFSGGPSRTWIDLETVRFLEVHPKCIGPLGASALARALQSNGTLSYLDLNFNKIGDLGSAAFGEALKLNCTLTHLYLNGNAINDSGAAALGEVLQSNYTLTHLHLMDNKIGESGGEAIGKVLQSNRALTHLDLEGNQIGYSGAEALAKALQSSGIRLCHLHLSYTNISSSGAIALAEALQFNRTLTRVSLDGNSIESSGAVAFAKALQTNQYLTHLDLSANDIDDSGATELAYSLQCYNNTLSYLNLNDNSVGSLGREHLAQVDQSNCIVECDT